MKRSYDGDPIDGTEQYITERPVQPGREDGETVYATDPDPEGEYRTEDVVMPDEVRAAATEDDDRHRGDGPSEREPLKVPDADETAQSTLWEWSR